MGAILTEDASLIGAMRILIATRLFVPETGVAAVRLAALARELVERGHTVDVVTSRPPRGLAATDEPGMTIRRWPVLRDRSGAVRGYVSYLSFDVPLFFRLLRAPRPDVIVVEPPPTTGTVVRWAAGIRRIPYVYYAADIVSDAAAQAGVPGAIVAAVRWMESRALRHAARVLAVSSVFAERVRELGAAPERVVEIGNGADTSIFRPEGPRQHSEVPYALYAGTASDAHGAEIFVDAIGSVDGLRLVFLGSGSRIEAIRAQGRRLDPGLVTVLAPVPPEEAASWLRGAAVALSSASPPSGSRAAYPFFPAKLHAAVAAGTPVLHAGGGAGAAFAEAAPFGSAVPYDATAIAAELQRRARGLASEEDRAALAAWAAPRVALTAVAKTAADAVEGATPTATGG